MDIIRSFGQLNIQKRTAVAVGYFDGMHIGHVSLIHEMLDYARQNDLVPTVLTFDMSSLRAEGKGLHDLFPRDYTTHLAEKEGIELYIDLPFEKIRDLEPDEFASGVLGKDFLNAAAIFSGTDFRYGKGRAGSIDDLMEEGKKYGFYAYAVDSVAVDDEPVSTSRIKELMKNGKVHEANRMLGRPYSICGEVIHGNHLAQGLGFPTANILFPKDILSPPKGVYLTNTILDGKRYYSISNIGTRPTVTDDVVSTAETHILDFDGDIYGKQIEVQFFEFMRPEQKFSGIDELRETVLRDVSTARKHAEEKALMQ